MKSFKIKATTPCYKFVKASPAEQLEKLHEELEEVAEAWKDYCENKNIRTLSHLLVELLDVKVCVNTAMAQLKHDDEVNLINNYRYCLDEAKKYVVHKNMRRGYYDIGNGYYEEEGE